MAQLISMNETENVEASFSDKTPIKYLVLKLNLRFYNQTSNIGIKCDQFFFILSSQYLPVNW